MWLSDTMAKIASDNFAREKKKRKKKEKQAFYI
jgi:hypothetical protein